MVPELIVLALDYYRAPLRFPQLADPSRRLPEGFNNLVGAIGSALSPRKLEETADSLGTTAEEIDQAARFFFRQVLLAPGSSHYRVLGVSRGASDETIRQHYQLLVRFFHPDRSLDDPERDAGYTARINEAYRVLKNPATRNKYDRQLAATAKSSPAPGSTGARSPLADPRARDALAKTSGLVGSKSRRVGTLLIVGVAALTLVVALSFYRSAKQPSLRVNPELANSSLSRPSYLRARPGDASVESEPPDLTDAEGPGAVDPSEDPSSETAGAREAIREALLRGTEPALPPDGSEPETSRPEMPGVEPLSEELASDHPALASVASLGAAATPSGRAFEDPPTPTRGDKEQTPAGPDSSSQPALSSPARRPASGGPDNGDSQAEALEAGGAATSALPPPVIIRPADPQPVADNGGASGRKDPPETTQNGARSTAPPPSPVAPPGEAGSGVSKTTKAEPDPARPRQGAEPAAEKVAVRPPQEVPRTQEKVESDGSSTANEQEEPTPPKPAVEPPKTPRLAPDDLIGQLTRYYRAGNLNAFVSLFTPDARVNEGSGRAVIRAAYGRFFSTTTARRFIIRGLGWRDAGNGRLVGAGTFTASKKMGPGSSWLSQRGTLSFELVPRNNRYLIAKMIYR